METDHHEAEDSEKSAADHQGSAKLCGCEKVKSAVADMIKKLAETMDKQVGVQDAPSGRGHYVKQASEWLEQSAEYVRQVDCMQADAKLRGYVHQHPERCLLIAGGIGLVLGAAWRRS